MKATVVGIKKFKSKKGNKMCVVNLIHDFSEKEVENLGAVGSQVFSGFTPREFNNDLIDESIIGKEVDAGFSFYNNQMNLIYLTV